MLRALLVAGLSGLLLLTAQTRQAAAEGVGVGLEDGVGVGVALGVDVTVGVGSGLEPPEQPTRASEPATASTRLVERQFRIVIKAPISARA